MPPPLRRVSYRLPVLESLPHLHPLHNTVLDKFRRQQKPSR